jgi:hypothetical protein
MMGLLGRRPVCRRKSNEKVIEIYVQPFLLNM